MRDTLPKSLTGQRESGIINLDSVENTGTHWVSYYHDPKDDRFVYYFDSFGLQPATEIVKFLKSTGKNILMNSSQIQDISTITCGYWGIYFIKELSKGNSFYDIMYNLDQDPTKHNEMFIRNYFGI